MLVVVLLCLTVRTPLVFLYHRKILNRPRLMKRLRRVIKIQIKLTWCVLIRLLWKEHYRYSWESLYMPMIQS